MAKRQIVARVGATGYIHFLTARGKTGLFSVPAPPLCLAANGGVFLLFDVNGQAG